MRRSARTPSWGNGFDGVDGSAASGRFRVWWNTGYYPVRRAEADGIFSAPAGR